MLIVSCSKFDFEEDQGYSWGKLPFLLTATTKTRNTSLAYNSIGLTFYTLSWAQSISASQTSTCKPGTCTPSTWHLSQQSWDLNPGPGVTSTLAHLTSFSLLSIFNFKCMQSHTPLPLSLTIILFPSKSLLSIFNKINWADWDLNLGEQV